MLHQLLIGGLGWSMWVENFQSHDPTHISWVRDFSTQVNIGDPSSTAPTTQPDSTAVEEEDLEVPADELEKYFFLHSTDLASSPIYKHLETMQEHFSGTFPIDPMASAQLQKSLLRIAKSADTSIATKVKEFCQ